MPPGAAIFAVGDRLQADLFLLADDLLDLAVLDLPSCAAVMALLSRLARASFRGAERSRLPTWSARNGALAITSLPHAGRAMAHSRTIPIRVAVRDLNAAIYLCDHIAGIGKKIIGGGNSRMAYKNLEEALQAAGNPVKMLRNSQIGAYVYPVVAPEFTNWRDEQRAWRRPACCSTSRTTWSTCSCAGKDTVKLLSHLATNSFKNFTVDKAKQFAPVHLRRPRDRRRHPVLSRRKRVGVCRPQPGRELDRIPRQDRRLRRRDRI